jgi:hypothetical protein
MKKGAASIAGDSSHRDMQSSKTKNGESEGGLQTAEFTKLRSMHAA